MNTHHRLARCPLQVSIEHVGIERSNGSHQLCHHLQAGEQGLIGGELVGVHVSSPETLLRQTHEPVGHVVHHKSLNQPSGARWLIRLIAFRHVPHERVQFRENPAVHLAALCHGHLRLLVCPAIHVGVHRQEAVGLLQLAEESSAHLLHALLVELQVVPGLRVGEHIPAQSVASILLNGGKGVNGIAQTLRHLLPVLVQNKSVGNHCLVSHTVLNHGGDGMECEEPSTRLVHALGNEVGGEERPLVYLFSVFKGIVLLCVGHGAAVEPHVDEVGLTPQRLTACAHQHDVVNVGTVQVDAVVVLLAHVAGHEAALLEGIGCHDAGNHGFLYLAIKLLHAAYAPLLARVAVAPDGQRRAPEATAAQVPVVQVLQPLAKASRARCLGLPLDGLVQLHHALLHRRGTDEPAVEGIVENRLVGAPAMGIVVHEFLYLERLSALLHLHAKHDVQVLGLGERLLVERGIARVVGILHEITRVLAIRLMVHEIGIELLVHVGGHEILAGEVDHGTRVALLVKDEQRGNASLLCHPGVVGTEGGSDVHDSRTVVGGHVIARDDAESLRRAVLHVVAHHLRRLHPGHQLTVVHAHEVAARVARHDFIVSLVLEISAQARLCHDGGHRLPSVGILRLHRYIGDFGTHAQGSVRGQRPGRGGPGKQHRLAMSAELRQGVDNLKLSSDGRILHVAVATGLVQLVRAETRAGSGTVGLNGVALIEKALLVELFQQPPQTLDVLVVVGNIRMVHVHPVAHLLAQRPPFVGVHHHVLAAALVIFVHRDGLADVLLGDSQFLLHAQFHRQSVGVPPRLAVHQVALHGLEPAERVLDGARQHMVDAGMSVGGWGSLEEHEGRTSLALLQTATEKVLPFPFCQHVLVHLAQVQPCSLRKVFCHCIILYKDVQRYKKSPT